MNLDELQRQPCRGLPLVHRLLLLLLLLLLSACGSVVTKSPSSIQEDVRQSQKASKVTLTAVGDTMLGGTAEPTMRQNGYDHPFSGTKELFAASDFVVANLEGPLTSRGHKADKRYTFRSPPEKVATALYRAGINLVTLANNHTLDYGEIGLLDTMKELTEAKVGFFGAGRNLEEARRAYISSANGLKIGFLGYSLTYPESFWAKKNRAGTAFGIESHVREDVRALSEKTDIVVVSFHWGREGTTKLRGYQVSLGRVAIDAGAKLVIGHHPHIAQGIERYGKGAILYSLGNYVFGSFSNRVQFGLVATATFEGKMLTAVKLNAVDVNNFRRYFRPELLTGERARSANREIINLAKQRGTQLAEKDGALLLQLPPCRESHKH